MTSPSSQWLIPLSDGRAPRVRLACLPFAGGHAHVFRGWRERVPDWVQLVGVELPGRGLRFGEPRLTNVDDVVALLGPKLAALDDAPLVLFGHSMGALLAFEVTRWLEHRKARAPVLLVLAAHRAASVPLGHEPMHPLPEAKFLEALRRYGGLPDEFWQNPELWPVYLPLLRADMQLCETYQFQPGKVSCPLLVLAGQGDPIVNVDDARAWTSLTMADAEFRELPGGHFFVKSHEPSVVAMVVEAIENVGRRPLLRAHLGLHDDKYGP